MPHLELDTLTLALLLRGGYANLKKHMATVDELNVFPVPDGDTGKNMTMTLEGGVSALEGCDAPVGDAMKAFSRGTLLSARGNSGVILSQFVRGFAEGTKGKDTLTVADFLAAYDSGVKRAYVAVGNPVEGTILTVMREAGADVTESKDFDECLGALTAAMRRSLAHTPELLPVLKEAGVVDSGGAGLTFLFEGMWLAEQGKAADEGGETLAVATAAPIAAAAPAERVRYAVVAVANGDGIAAYFREIGATAIVEGGQTNNPPAEAFLTAFAGLNAEHILVLPNDPNILMTAKQAAELAEGVDVRVLPTRSLAEGYSALSMMDLSLSTVEEVIREMTHYLPNVTTGYVTTATRDANLNGVAITKGHCLGLTRDVILADSVDKVDAALLLLERLPDIADKQVVTVFVGQGVTDAEQAAFAAGVAARWPLIELGFVPGGQDVYFFIMAIE